MSNRLFEVYISEKEIYDKLLPEHKERFNNVRIVDAHVTHLSERPNSGGSIHKVSGFRKRNHRA